MSKEFPNHPSKGGRNAIPTDEALANRPAAPQGSGPKQASSISVEVSGLMQTAVDITEDITGADLANMPEHCSKLIVKLKKHTENMCQYMANSPFTK